MGDFLELGLELGDKLIDKGFDKLPDRITSPLGAEIHRPAAFHRRKGSRDPKRSATMPVEEPRRRGSVYDDDDGYERDSEDSPRRQRAVAHTRDRRDEPYPNDRNAVNVYAPNPEYDGRRPKAVTRRSQSYAPPRSRRSPSYYDGSRTPSPDRNSKLTNPVTTGALGALVGGVLANQAGKATGYDYRRDSRDALNPGSKKSKRSKSSRRPGEGDEALLTLAGALIGGIGGALAGDKWKDRKKKREKVNQEWNAEQARQDWEREGHEAEAWAQDQDLREQTREARRWQAQVEEGQRYRERSGRDDVVVLEERREERRPGRVEEVVRIQPVYEDRYYGDEERRFDPGPKYERRERRRSVDDERDLNGRRWNMDYNENYGYGRDKERERHRR